MADSWSVADASPGAIGDVAPPEGQPYANWALANIPAGTASEKLADPDHDGVPNLAEYALGTNPVVAEAAPLLPFEVADGNRTVSYVPNAGAVEASVSVEISSDRQTWTALESGPADGNGVVRATLPAGNLEMPPDHCRLQGQN